MHLLKRFVPVFRLLYACDGLFCLNSGPEFQHKFMLPMGDTKTCIALKNEFMTSESGRAPVYDRSGWSYEYVFISFQSKRAGSKTAFTSACTV